MRILSPEFTQKWHEKMVNIHPSLLPSFKGENAIKDALTHGVKITGCTVHFVEEKVDSGKIIAQEPVRIDDFETPQSLREKMKLAEKITYTQALKFLTVNLP
jgi:phosphoribosylglycinamide formyltransferase-1